MPVQSNASVARAKLLALLSITFNCHQINLLFQVRRADQTGDGEDECYSPTFPKDIETLPS